MKALDSVQRFGQLTVVALVAALATACAPPITLTAPPGPTSSQMVATPAFSPTGGTFTTDQSVSISIATAGAAIYYTTDGTVPTTSSNLYAGPIPVQGNGILKNIIAIGVLSGSSNSGLAAVSYKISHAISTVAGNGTSGFSGDGGAATSAQFYYPAGMAVDGSGNYYVADPYNHRVRKVSAIGTITTIAGSGVNGLMVAGAATSSPMEYPVAVALDSTATNLYIADVAANAVYKVLLSGPTISLFAGSATGVSGFSGNGGAATSALLANPSGVAVSSSGNVYIADTGNNVVRVVAGGNIGPFAGNQAAGAGFSGDGSASGLAQLSGPQGVAVDSTGRVYIADTGNNRVRRVSTLSVITTVAGGPSSNPYWQDGGIATSSNINGIAAVATDSSGNFYLTTYGNVLKVDPAGYLWDMAGFTNYNGSWPPPLGDGGPAASAYVQLTSYYYYPSGIAVDSSGSIYISDTYNYRIRKVQ